MPTSEKLEWDREKYINKFTSKPGKICEYGFSYNSGTNVDFLSINKIKDLIKNNLN